MSAATTHLEVRDLGRMPYAPAHELQRALVRQVVETRPHGPAMFLLLVEHDPPVITVSRRPGARAHLVATEGQLAAAGVQVAETDRGGDVTYHGPGQLVAYPILDLNRLRLRSRSYLRFLEQVVIDLLAGWGLAARRDETATGVWLGAGAGAKVCAIGVRISRWVSMHGLALNVDPDLAHFDLIVPCGLTGRAVTSLRRELGPRCPSMDEARRRLAGQLGAAVADRLREAGAADG